jgi:hypothetical protein
MNSPLLYAFKIFRNYDDAGGEFGSASLTATSADQGKLSVYAARRTADRELTVMVINKTFGDLHTDLTLDHFKARAPAKVYQYSGADLKKIRVLPAVKTSKSSAKTKESVLNDQLFPAMSITLYAIASK